MQLTIPAAETLHSLSRYMHIRVNARLEVLDAHGDRCRPLGQIEIVGTRLCIVGKWLLSYGTMHRVRFRCGRELWVESRDATWFDEAVHCA